MTFFPCLIQVVLKNKYAWLFACGLLRYLDLLMESAAATDASYRSVPQQEVISATAVPSLLGTHTHTQLVTKLSNISRSFLSLCPSRSNPLDHAPCQDSRVT